MLRTRKEPRRDLLDPSESRLRWWAGIPSEPVGDGLHRDVYKAAIELKNEDRRNGAFHIPEGAHVRGNMTKALACCSGRQRRNEPKLSLR